MNDDFLRRAWRQPPAAFERQLRERLRQQELTEPPRRRPTWGVLIASLLIGGSALATITYLTAKHFSSTSSPAVEMRDASEGAASSPAQSSKNAGGASYPRSPGAATLYVNRLHSSATQSPEATGTASGVRDIDPSAADTSSSSAQSNGAARSLARSSVRDRLIRVATTPELEELSAGITSTFSYRASARTEITSADQALRALCADTEESPPLAVAMVSRRITRFELQECKPGLREAQLGHMATVITGAKLGNKMQLSADIIARAVLKQVPSPDDPRRLIDNPYTEWSQIDRSLERRRIEVLGPPRDSQFFRVFAATLLEPGCEWLQASQNDDRAAYQQSCHTLRDDVVYKEATWDNTFVGQRLWADPNVVAVLDYSFYAANSADLLGSMLIGPPPTARNITDGTYKGARTVYMYVGGLHYRNGPNVSSLVDDYLRRFNHDWYKWMIPPQSDQTRRRFEPLPLLEVKFE